METTPTSIDAPARATAARTPRQAPPRRPGRAAGAPGPLWAALACVAVWAVWAAIFNQAQFGDNIEQFNWSHSLQWGYAKHPPLPTWLMGAAIAVLGRRPEVGYLMPALCFAATAAFTWGIARRLLGARGAAAALLLWTLQFSFSWRAQLYNHNTALVLCIAATVWASLKALEGGFGWWPVAGAAAGAAMLSKYQALLPLGGLLLALAWTGRLHERRHLVGVAVACVVLLALFAPHAAWVMRHDFTTLRYAATSVDAGGATTSHALRAVLSFAANQLRMLSMLLLAVALYAGWRRLRPAPAPARQPPPEASPDAFADRDASRWLAGLLWAPALLLMATAVAGVSLRNHWGVQMFQFVSLWIAWRWQRKAAIGLRRLAWIVLALHATLLAAYALQQRTVRLPDDGGRRLDTRYPAAGLARAVTAQWRTAAGPACPLRYVSGNVYLAGLAALHAGEDAVVYEGPAATPWVDPAHLESAGRVAIVETLADLPARATRVQAYALGSVREPQAGRTIFVAVLPPSVPCR